MNKHVLMGNTLTFTFNGSTFRMEKQANLAFGPVETALKAGDYENAYALYKASKLETGKLVIKNDSIKILGTDIKLGRVYVDAFLYAKHYGEASEKILEKFIENVAKNPDPRARDGLSDFLAHAKMPVTDRGTFLAYRAVNPQFKDAHTSTMDNMIGNDVKMDRSECDSDPNQDCSRGLHVKHHDYGMFSTHQLVVEINPRDVVAVPDSYNAKKMRVCRFRPLCMLDYFKQMLLIREQAALAMVPVFMTEQTRTWVPQTGVPDNLLHRYNPTDAWAWAAA